MMALKSQCVDTDRISALPDALLCHILSYITTKKSVQTSILSKRWLHVWTGLPDIDIDDSILSLDPTLARDQSVYTSFTNFRTKVLNRGKETSLRKFTLTCSKFDMFHVYEWILAAVKQRVRKLVLSVTIEVPFIMSWGLFAYKELVTLKLRMKLVLTVPNGTFCFPSLKKLRLKYVVFDDDSIHNFLSRCPILEELHVEYCSSKMWDNVIFSAPALKVFVINTLASTEDDYGCDYKLIVDAPSLESLDFTGYLATKGYCFKNLNSLVHATLDVCVDEEEMGHIHRVLELFRGVANAELITLTGYTLEVLHLYFTLEEHNVNSFPFFNNVRELVVGGNMYCGKLLPQLLYFSPNLKVLIIEDDLAMKGDLNDFYWENIVAVPECLSGHLLLVEIWGYNGQKHVAKFIRYILSNGGAKTNVYASRVRSELMKVELIDQEFAYFDEWGVRIYKG